MLLVLVPVLGIEVTESCPQSPKRTQRFFGMVRATQKGEMENPSPEVAKVAATAKRSDVKKFASTKHKKLPEKVVSKEETKYDRYDAEKKMVCKSRQEDEVW